jgi:homoserine O-acetyltransferase
MLSNDYYSQAVHGPYELYDLGNFTLEEGGTLRPGRLAYTTHGRLNAKKDNAILITSWYSGSSKIWETTYIGEGRALDPDKYFIICTNQLGNGLSTSPHNTDGVGGRGRFPHVRIGDDVRAQHQLVTEHFGIGELALVIGGSMGAQQTYEWAVRYPDMVKRAAPICGTARNTPHDFLYVDTLMEAIRSDPGFKQGWYDSHAEVREGLRRHSRLWSVMGFSTEFYRREVWRHYGFSSLDDFLVNFFDAYFLQMDPNALMTMMWKWQRGDVTRHTGGDLAAALGRIKARTFVMPIDEDMFFPPRDCAAEQALIPNSEFRLTHSVCGHLVVFGVDPDWLQQVDGHLKELLALPA